ncbi:MAG: hypothetical protein ACKOA8_15530 [Deltaproteobacteria bacterium]
MRNYFRFVAVFLMAFSIGKPLSAGPGREERKEEQAVRRIEAYEPARQVKEYQALKEAAKDAKERQYWEKKISEVNERMRFLGTLNSLPSATSPANSAGRTSTETLPSEKASRTEISENKDHTAEAFAMRRRGSGRQVEPSRTLDESVAIVKKSYEKSTYEEKANSLLESTLKDVKGNKEAEEGLKRLLEEVIKAQGNPEKLLNGIIELTKKNKLNAEDTLEIARAMCADRCVVDRGVCRIASQLTKLAVQGGALALAGGLAAYTLNSVKAGECKEGQCSVTLEFKSIKDPNGPTTKVETKIEDKEQDAEKFPANPKSSG